MCLITNFMLCDETKNKGELWRFAKVFAFVQGERTLPICCGTAAVPGNNLPFIPGIEEKIAYLYFNQFHLSTFSTLFSELSNQATPYQQLYGQNRYGSKCLGT
jgi:hypothetical protein